MSSSLLRASLDRLSRLGPLGAIVVLGLWSGGARHLEAGQPQPSPVFGTRTTAVVVDVIVRDRKGRPVTDLGLQDFEILEDGVRQEIGALSLVAPDVPGDPDGPRRLWQTGLPADTAPAAPDVTFSEGAAAVPGQTVVAIAFERLTPESRAVARDAALTYLDAPERAGDFVGVFLIDLSLETLQTFTDDREALRTALENAALRATSYSEPNRVGPGTGAAPATIGAESRGGRWIWPADMQAGLADISQIAEDGFRSLTDLQHGHASLNALQGLVSAMGLLPGRKTIVYFSDGLSVYQDEVQARFDALIHLANRLNVSIYPIDAVGLRVHSQGAANAQALREAVTSGLDSEAGSGAGLGAALAIMRGGSTTHVFGRLARETGGFVIENTNDLAGGFRRIDADRRFHYLLAYTPKNAELDGTFRRIEVRVARKGVSVRARSGYTAVPSPGVIPTLSYEAGAVAALDADPRPQDIRLDARALRIPAPSAPGRVALLVRVPGGDVTFQVGADGARYRTDFTILARIRDEGGRVVRKGSQPYRLTGPAPARDSARQGDILFFRQPQLPPGRYAVECVVFDALTERAGSLTLPLEIPDAAPAAIAAGDLVIVQRAEAVPPSDRDGSNPLLVNGDLLLYPNVGEPIEAGLTQTLTLYVVARPARDRPDLTGTLTVTRDRQAVATPGCRWVSLARTGSSANWYGCRFQRSPPDTTASRWSSRTARTGHIGPPGSRPPNEPGRGIGLRTAGCANGTTRRPSHLQSDRTPALRAARIPNASKRRSGRAPMLPVASVRHGGSRP